MAILIDLGLTSPSGAPRGGRGGESHFRRGGTFLKNGQIYVKLVKFTLKKVKFSVKTDKRAENQGRTGERGTAEGAAQLVT